MSISLDRLFGIKSTFIGLLHPIDILVTILQNCKQRSRKTTTLVHHASGEWGKSQNERGKEKRVPSQRGILPGGVHLGEGSPPVGYKGGRGNGSPPREVSSLGGVRPGEGSPPRGTSSSLGCRAPSQGVPHPGVGTAPSQGIPPAGCIDGRGFCSLVIACIFFTNARFLKVA